MNYIYWVKTQATILMFMYLSSLTTYAIIRHFEWGNRIVLNQIGIVGTVFGSFIFIFLGAYWNYKQFKK
jgi:hypothetical protein